MDSISGVTGDMLSEFESPEDLALDEVTEALLALDPTGARWAAVVRHTYDMLYNGAETGRYLWKGLVKTEKTHFGTLFEINAQREFEFADGSGDPDDPLHKGLDYSIAGHDVDAKWSQDDGRWMLPPEVFGKLALVATGSDPKSEFSVGLRTRPPGEPGSGTARAADSTASTASTSGTCSHIRTTVHPALTNAADAAASRSTVRASLGCQYSVFLAGREPCLGQECQKHPSTKTATRRAVMRYLA